MCEYANKGAEFLAQLKEDVFGACGVGMDFFEQEVQAVLRLNVIFEYAETKGRIVQTVDLTPERNVPVTFLSTKPGEQTL